MRVTAAGVAIAVACLGSVGAAFALKEPCIVHPWGPPERPFQYVNYCYSDILPQWFAKNLNNDQEPYTVADITKPGVWEYPVLTGYFAFAVAKMTTGLAEYMHVTNVLLSLAAAGVALAMWRIGATHAMMTAYALVPGIPLHGLTSWDLLAVLPAMWGWFLWRRGRADAIRWRGLMFAGLSAMMFGFGGAAKLYPAFFLPFLGLDTLARRDWKGTGAVAAGGFLGLVVPNAIAALRNWDGWLATYRFHAERSTDFETPWETVIKPWAMRQWPERDWGQGWTDFVGDVTIAVMGVFALWFAWRNWKGKLTPLAAGGILVIVFALINKVYSPQYTLWLLPILLLLRANWTAFAGWAVMDAFNVWVRYKYFTPAETGVEWMGEPWPIWSQRAVNFRWLFLLWCLVSILIQYGLIPRFWQAKPIRHVSEPTSSADYADYADPKPSGPRTDKESV